VTPTAVVLEDVTVRYAGSGGVVLAGLSLSVAAGESMAILGPSGCGKTTLLKAVAGLLPVAAGRILFDGAAVEGRPTEQRQIAMVFQKPLLFPHLNVAENVAFGLRMRKTPEALRRQRVEEALRLLQLESLAGRKSQELSGGQEQRVALARALVTEPRVLLLDEPFSALDANLRKEMGAVLVEIQQRLRLTTLFVTHDQQEAVHLAGRVALLRDGRVEQVGPPLVFYRAPQSAEAALFFGWQRLGDFYFRPEAASLAAVEGRALTGVVERVLHLGATIRVSLRLATGERVEMERPWDDDAARRAQVGDTAGVDVPEHARLRFPG
jgi:putative spermidine/putrescine transport system ATP-binding protein